MFETGSSFSSVINNRTVAALAQRIAQHLPTFKSKAFIQFCFMEKQMYGERIQLVKTGLKTFLPPVTSVKDAHKNAKILVKSLPPRIEESEAGTSRWDSFIVMPMGEYVQESYLAFPLTPIEIAQALDQLKIMTISFTSENSVRPFLRAYEKETLRYLYDCTKDKNVHVRRWASEGVRPRLPLASPIQRFKINPRPLLPILEALKDDSHDYVYRSVANLLNDIAKDNPDFVTTLLVKWNKNAGPTRSWLIKHALRTLIKKGNPQALAIMGIKIVPFTLGKINITKTVKKGSHLAFQATLINGKQPAQFIIDFGIMFKKHKKESIKIFKLKKAQLLANEKVLIEGKFCCKDYSTRKVYPGKHKFFLQINGDKTAPMTFSIEL
jgi:3-methyladenine DNA glycosylase AlkC